MLDKIENKNRKKATDGLCEICDIRPASTTSYMFGLQYLCLDCYIRMLDKQEKLEQDLAEQDYIDRMDEQNDRDNKRIQ